MTQKNKEIKIQTKTKSMKYPLINLEDAIQLSARLIAAYPKSSFNRIEATISIEESPTSSNAVQKIATLTYYGLLTKTRVKDDKSVYKNSDLASRIVDFISEDDKNQAKVEAVKHSSLFASLINEFVGRSIPPTLKNILISKHKIHRDRAEKIAQNFEDSIRYAGMYDNGVITDPSRSSESEKSDDQAVSQIIPEQKNSGQSQSNTLSRFDMPLSRGVSILYPSHLSYAFGSGEFRDEVKALKKKIKEFIGENDEENDQHNEENGQHSEENMDNPVASNLLSGD